MRKNFKMPSAYTILFLIIIVVAILTWIIPAGQYNYVDPSAVKKIPIPETYHLVEGNPQGITDVIMAPVSGFYDAIEVALFITRGCNYNLFVLYAFILFDTINFWTCNFDNANYGTTSRLCWCN